MIESEVRAAVNKLIADNNLAAEIVECACDDDGDDDDGYWSVRVGVERQDYERAIMADRGPRDYSLHWHQKTPPLVAANVGDLVLIFSDYAANDADSDVGIVSAKYTKENGDVHYGCRYIQIGLNNQFLRNNRHNFELTAENYGGYPTGFLKVLTAQEVSAHLQSQLDIALQQTLEAAQEKYERSIEYLPALIASLSQGEKIKCDMIDLSEAKTPFGVNVINP